MSGCGMEEKKNQNKTVPQRMLCKGESLGLLLRNMNCSRLTIRAFGKKKKKMLLMTCQEMMDTIDKALFLSKLNEIFYSSLVLVGGPGTHNHCVEKHWLCSLRQDFSVGRLLTFWTR